MTDEPPLRTDFGDVTLERLERGVANAAYIVARFGPEYAPIFERLERDLFEFRQRQDPVDRARAWLAQNSIEGNKNTGKQIIDRKAAPC